MIESELLKAEEAMEILRISRWKIYEMIRTKKIPHIRLGRKVYIPSQALYQWIESHTIGA